MKPGATTRGDFNSERDILRQGARDSYAQGPSR